MLPSRVGGNKSLIASGLKQVQEQGSADTDPVATFLSANEGFPRVYTFNDSEHREIQKTDSTKNGGHRNQEGGGGGRQIIWEVGKTESILSQPISS